MARRAPGLGHGQHALPARPNTYVELLARSAPGAVRRRGCARTSTQRGEGPYALAFGTDDADACAAALRARRPDGGRAGRRQRPRPRERRRARAGATLFLSPSETRGVPLFVIEHRSPPDALPPAAPPATRRRRSSGVDHAVIMTADADAAIALYRDRLGLRLAFDRTFEERGVRLLFFRIGGITVELAAPLGAAADAGGDAIASGASRTRVPDVDAARARLAAAGFDVSEVRPGNKPGTRVCTVRRETHGVATLLIDAARERASRAAAAISVDNHCAHERSFAHSTIYVSLAATLSTAR